MRRDGRDHASTLLWDAVGTALLALECRLVARSVGHERRGTCLVGSRDLYRVGRALLKRRHDQISGVGQEHRRRHSRSKRLFDMDIERWNEVHLEALRFRRGFGRTPWRLRRRPRIRAHLGFVATLQGIVWEGVTRLCELRLADLGVARQDRFRGGIHQEIGVGRSQGWRVQARGLARHVRLGHLARIQRHAIGNASTGRTEVVVLGRCRVRVRALGRQRHLGRIATARR